MNQDRVYAGTVLLVGFSAKERQAIGIALTPSGYATVSGTVFEALDAGAYCPIHAVVVDGRANLERGLRHAAQARQRQQQLPLVLLVPPDEPFVYRRTRSLGRVVVLYAPVSTAAVLDALDALDALTTEPPAPCRRAWSRNERTDPGQPLGPRSMVG